MILGKLKKLQGLEDGWNLHITELGKRLAGIAVVSEVQRYVCVYLCYVCVCERGVGGWERGRERERDFSLGELETGGGAGEKWWGKRGP